MRYSKSGGGKPPLNLHYNRYGNIGRKKKKKKKKKKTNKKT